MSNLFALPTKWDPPMRNLKELLMARLKRQSDNNLTPGFTIYCLWCYNSPCSTMGWEGGSVPCGQVKPNQKRFSADLVDLQLIHGCHRAYRRFCNTSGHSCPPPSQQVISHSTLRELRIKLGFEWIRLEKMTQRFHIEIHSGSKFEQKNNEIYHSWIVYLFFRPIKYYHFSRDLLTIELPLFTFKITRFVYYNSSTTMIL